MSARNLAEAHLSFAGMIVWFSSTAISALLSMRLPHPLGEPRQMIGGVAERMFDDHATAKIVADRVFLGHPDAAMQLHRVLCNKPARLADPDFGHCDVAGPLRGIGLIDHHRGEHRHAAALLQRDKHFRCAVLQYLVLTDRLAKLLA